MFQRESIEIHIFWGQKVTSHQAFAGVGLYTFVSRGFFSLIN